MRVSVVVALLVSVGCGDSDADAGNADDEGSNATTEAVGGSSSGAMGSSDGPLGTGSDGLDGGSDSGESSGGSSSVCSVAGVVGQCVDVAECAAGSRAFQGVCGGEPSNQCCVPTEGVCSRFGAPGVCINNRWCGDPLEISASTTCSADEGQGCCTDPLTKCGADAKPLPNEGLVEEPWDDACPDGMVLVGDDFLADGVHCIDRYEASLLVVDPETGDSVSTWSPYHNPGQASVKAVSLRGAVPQGNISQVQAAAACEAADKRLCTPNEWIEACRGPEFHVFPYGDGWINGACNDNRALHPAIEYFGVAEDWILDEYDHPCLTQLPDSLALTGQYEQCVSDPGAHDMMGNLHEWTASGPGFLRGGDFYDAINAGTGCYFERGGLNITEYDFSTGFRCCVDAVAPRR